MTNDNEIPTIGYVEKDCRWRAIITYQVTGSETRKDIYDVFEIEELQDIVEQGPTFCSIVDFRIEYCGPKETIKESMEQ